MPNWSAFSNWLRSRSTFPFGRLKWCDQLDEIMAETEMTEDSYTEEYVCVEEYFPLDLHEEEVVAEPLDGQEITIIQPIESHEILQGKEVIFCCLSVKGALPFENASRPQYPRMIS